MTPVLLLTPRDRDVFRDVYRFGCLSAVQLALRHWPDSVSDKTARNRLWQLCEAGYLVRRPIGHREDGAYLLTPKGRAELGLPTKHARPDPRASSSLRHRLIVADVADWFLARRYRGGEPEWVTEVDVYDGRFPLARRAPRPRRDGREDGSAARSWCRTGWWCSEAGSACGAWPWRWSCTRRRPGSTRPSWPGTRPSSRRAPWTGASGCAPAPGGPRRCWLPPGGRPQASSAWWRRTRSRRT